VLRIQPPAFRPVPFLALALAIWLVHVAALAAQDPGNKTPVPDQPAREKALKLVKDVFGEEYERAETSSRKLDLAKELLREAAQTKDDPVAHFVLLDQASDLAARAGEAGVAFQAVDEMDEVFAIDAPKRKVAAVSKLAESARTTTQNKLLAQYALILLDDLVADDRFDTAEQIGATILDAARKARDGKLVRHVVTRNKQIARIAKAYAQARTAFATLRKNPTDPKANLAAGKYLCYLKGDWDRGLPMLAQGSDETLKTLAATELQKPASAAQQAKLADGWWQLAKEEEDTARRQLQLHAADWYRKAVGALSGLSRAKAESRLEEVDSMESRDFTTSAGGSEDSRSKTTHKPDGKEPQVVAVWRHSAGGGRGGEIKFYSNGRINSPDGRATWGVQGNVLILVWPADRAPGGRWIDRCVLSPDRRFYLGKNQNNVTIRGRLVQGGI